MSVGAEALCFWVSSSPETTFTIIPVVFLLRKSPRLPLFLAGVVLFFVGWLIRRFTSVSDGREHG
jgi:phosphatidate phosphatase APP1